MSPSYDDIDITKQEVLEYLRLFHLRLKSNPRVSRKVRGKLAADIKLIDWFESEAEVKYHVGLSFELIDGIRSIIDRKKANKDKPKMAVLDQIHKDAMIRKIVLPPEVMTEHEVMKIIAQAKQVMYKNG